MTNEPAKEVNECTVGIKHLSIQRFPYYGDEIEEVSDSELLSTPSLKGEVACFSISCTRMLTRTPKKIDQISLPLSSTVFHSIQTTPMPPPFVTLQRFEIRGPLSLPYLFSTSLTHLVSDHMMELEFTPLLSLFESVAPNLIYLFLHVLVPHHIISNGRHR